LHRKKTWQTGEDKMRLPAKEQEKLDYLRSEAAIARAVYNRLGAGFPPFTKSGSWMDSHRFANQPARYKTGYKESIFAVNPVNYLTISPTVKIYARNSGQTKSRIFFSKDILITKFTNARSKTKRRLKKRVKKLFAGDK
jgi:hypothetical protein